MKIRKRNKQWIEHYRRLGEYHECFGTGNSLNGYWPYSENGVSADQAFAIRESTGKTVKTNAPDGITVLTAGKKLHGMTVEMWAEDRATGCLCKAELMEYCDGVPGLFEEVEKRKYDFV